MGQCHHVSAYWCVFYDASLSGGKRDTNVCPAAMGVRATERVRKGGRRRSLSFYLHEGKERREAVSKMEKKVSGNTLKIHLAFRLYETQKFISTITYRQIAQLFFAVFFVFPAVGTANSWRNWKMMKYYQLGLQGRSSSNITAVSFFLIAQSLHFKEDEALRWRCALRPTFAKKKRREKRKKERRWQIFAAFCCGSNVGTAGAMWPCGQGQQGRRLAGPLCCAGGSAEHNKNWANSGEKESLEAGSLYAAVPACWLVDIFQKTITMTE